MQLSEQPLQQIFLYGSYAEETELAKSIKAAARKIDVNTILNAVYQYSEIIAELYQRNLN